MDLTSAARPFGIAAVGLTLALMVLIGDPLVLFMLLVSGVVAVFPTYQHIVLAASALSAARLVTRHDTVTGKWTSVVTAVAEAVDATLVSTAFVVCLMSLAPAAGTLMTLDLWGAWEDLLGALPLVALVAAKVLVERFADDDLTDMASVYLSEASKNFQALAAALR